MYGPGIKPAIEETTKKENIINKKTESKELNIKKDTNSKIENSSPTEKTTAQKTEKSKSILTLVKPKPISIKKENKDNYNCKNIKDLNDEKFNQLFEDEKFFEDNDDELIL